MLNLFPQGKILKLAQTQAKTRGDIKSQSLDKRLSKPTQAVGDIRVWNSPQSLTGYAIHRVKSHIIDIIPGIFWLYATVVIF